MLRRIRVFCFALGRRARDARGVTLLEVLVGMVLMSMLALGVTTLAGAAVRSKVIAAARVGTAETSRETLEWMAERLRNAGLNLRPSEQAQLRCRDMVVAQDATLLPTSSSVYVSGEILNADTTPGNEVITLGYLLGTDSRTGRTIVIESTQPCSAGAVTTAPLSDPRITVTGLTFAYFTSAGAQVMALTDPVQIRTIRLLRISLTAQYAEGRSGTQTLTLTRNVMLRNPEPNSNDWKNPNETP